MINVEPLAAIVADDLARPPRWEACASLIRPRRQLAGDIPTSSRAASSAGEQEHGVVVDVAMKTEHIKLEQRSNRDPSGETVDCGK